MIDIFNNYKLQREELLARIAMQLELDKTRKEKMKTAYNAVTDMLNKDDKFFDRFEINIYPQGSVRIGTTVKPINKDDFDLDTVLHIQDLYYNNSPSDIYNALLRVISNNGTYQNIYEKKSRCIRLNYKNDFHMDILPACMQNTNDNETIAIPEKELESWSFGNPKGYANWFLEKTKPASESLLESFRLNLFEAKVESDPLPNDFYLKSPLQRAVQLSKRYRDIYFEDKDGTVSSIVITTLFGKFYSGENSIYDTINNVMKKIKQNFNDAISKRVKFKVLNPVNSQEDFTDSWTKKEYDNFYEFIENFYNEWKEIEQSFEDSSSSYIKLFGEGQYKESLRNQISKFHDISDDKLTKANGLILTNQAHTDKKGNINSNRGQKNEQHHNFGG